jgi:ribose/xylose/arabinose/galactoside ABC-type transport system permease subunit
MSAKTVIIYAVIAAVVGVVMGIISRLTGADLDIFPFIVPIIIFVILSGGNQVISKKKKEANKDDRVENPVKK